MKIIVGSENPVKVRAITHAFSKFYSNCCVSGRSVSSGVSKQPVGLDEICNGAYNRAMHAFELGAELGVGVESGIFRLNNTYFDVCNVSLYDGISFYDGGSPYFEVPDKIVKQILKGGELGDFFDCRGRGAIGILTNDRITRSQQVFLAGIIAVARYFNREMYS